MRIDTPTGRSRRVHGPAGAGHRRRCRCASAPRSTSQIRDDRRHDRDARSGVRQLSRAGVAIGFGMNFVDVVATDQQRRAEQHDLLRARRRDFYTAESASLAGDRSACASIQNAIGDANPAGPQQPRRHLLHGARPATALRTLVDSALVGANPINSGGCGVFACNPNVNYNGGSIAGTTPSTTLTLIPGGLHATVDAAERAAHRARLRHDVLHRRLDDHGHRRATISATVDFSLQLQGGELRTGASSARRAVTVGNDHAQRLGLLRLRRQPAAGLLHRHGQERGAERADELHQQQRRPAARPADVEPRHHDARASRSRCRVSTAPARSRSASALGVLVARHHDHARAARHRHAVHARHDRAEPAEPRHRAAHRRPRCSIRRGTSPSQPGRHRPRTRACSTRCCTALWRGGYFQATLEHRRRHRGDRQPAAAGRGDRREQDRAADARRRRRRR